MLRYLPSHALFHFTIMLTGVCCIGIIWTYVIACLGKVFTLKWMQRTCTMGVIELQLLKSYSLMGHKIHGVMRPNRPHLLTVSLHLLSDKYSL